MGIKNFFKNAFGDMKESAKAIGNPNRRKAVFQADRDAQIRDANERKAAAEARIDAVKNN